MTEFAYTNAKNRSISHIMFELNYGYYFCVYFKDNINLYSKSHSVDKLIRKLKNLISICEQNLLNAQKLQKQAYNKRVKPQSYALSEKK